MTIQQILSKLFGNEKPETAYDRKPALVVIVYNQDGTDVAIGYANDIELIKQNIAKTPQLWGCKILTYKLDNELSVDIPVNVLPAVVASPATTQS